MKNLNVAAVVCEYNPFHQGHWYHLKETRRICDADYIIAIMSGNFVQRGEPAIVGKWARTEMALRCGADLVVELPVPYALSSAQFFAAGAVDLICKILISARLPLNESALNTIGLAAHDISAI